MKINYTKLLQYLALVATLLLVGCPSGGGGGGSPAPAVTLSSIAITPGSATIAKGLTASLTATGTYSDASTANITTQVNWTSADSDIASVGPQTGIVSADAVGSTTVTAALGGVTSPGANITVTAATLSSIAVTPLTASIAKGTTSTFTATGTYSDHSSGNISGTVTWISSYPAVATLNNSGIATGVGIGSSLIIAELNGKTSNSATLTVTAPVAVAIAITPDAPSVMVGASVNLTASLIYSDATTENVTSTASWTSGDPGIATVGLHTGVATGVAVGSTSITAAAGGLTSPGITLSVTIYIPPICSWDITTWDNCLWGN